MTEMQKSLALFSGSISPEVAEKIADQLGVDLGNVKLEKFANGEIYARYMESLRGADVFLIQSVAGNGEADVNDALMELLIMADAAKRASARAITAVITHRLAPGPDPGLLRYARGPPDGSAHPG